MTAVPKTPGDIAIMKSFLLKNLAFSSWSHEAMSQLLSSSRMNCHAAGSFFSSELNGEAEIFLIISGEALFTLVYGENRKNVVMIVGSGALMGIAQIFDGAGHCHFAFRAHSSVTAIHMPTSVIVEILDREPALWKNMITMMARQHAAYVHTLSGQIAGSLRQRVATTVERLVTLYGARARGDSLIRLKMSQAELALMLQANRQAVHKELKAIAASGAIRLEYKAVAIQDIDLLRSYSIQAQGD